MLKIEYPSYNFRVREENDRHEIFDDVRKVWLKLTPEEWVRQNFVRYLMGRSYPPSLISIEKKIVVGELNKRFDILVYDGTHRPWMMVECKATNVALSDDVLSQVLRYNIAVPVRYLVITNGNHCMIFEKRDGKIDQAADLPSWQ